MAVRFADGVCQEEEALAPDGLVWIEAPQEFFCHGRLLA
jgi:hypothetical protein